MKFTIYLFVMITITMVNGKCYGQEDHSNIKVPLTLEKNFDSSFFYRIEAMKFIETNYDVASIKLKSKAVFTYSTNDNQQFFENYKNKLIPDSIYNMIVQQRKLDIKNYSDLSYDHKILVLLGKSLDDNLIVIPDINNNNDFNDDITYNLGNSVSKNLEIDNVVFRNIQYAIGNESRNLILPYNIIIDVRNNDVRDYTVKLKRSFFWQGSIDFNSIKKNFLIDLLSSGFDFRNQESVEISFGNTLAVKDYKNSRKQFYSWTDTVSFDGLRVKLDSVSTFGDYAYFSIAKADSNTDHINDIIKNLSGTNIITDKSAKLINKGNYTLVDFWASWCHPCLAQHEVLKRMLPSFKAKKIEIYGVVIDDLKNKELALHHLLKQNIGWTNILVLKNSNLYSKFKTFKIDEGFPLYVLIDNNNLSIVAITENLKRMLKIIIEI